MSTDDVDPIARYLQALLALQLRSAGPDARFESLLDALGFSAKEASKLLGKSEAAVAKAMQRARTSKNN